MKFEFKGQFVQATAETTSENLMLLEATGSVKVTSTKVEEPKQRRKYTKQKVSKEARLEKTKQLKVLQEQLSQIPPGSKGFITREMARTSKDFPSYTHYILTRKYKHRYSITKVFGGYEVSVLS